MEKLTNRELFRNIYTLKIIDSGRSGARELLEWIENSDFYEAPASTRFHGDYEGGLCEHSLNVYTMLSQKGCCLDKYKEDTIAIVGLLHDLCKVNFYCIDYRNAKDEHGVWQKVPFYTIKDEFPFGHGEKSVYVINNFLKLSKEEALAIRWHMNGFDDTCRGGNSIALGDTYNNYPLAVELAVADLRATYLEESKK